MVKAAAKWICIFTVVAVMLAVPNDGYVPLPTDATSHAFDLA